MGAADNPVHATVLASDVREWFAEEVVVDPPPEEPGASDLLVLGAALVLGATALWVTALLSRVR
jgi:hypothetical protein